MGNASSSLAEGPLLDCSNSSNYSGSHIDDDDDEDPALYGAEYQRVAMRFNEAIKRYEDEEKRKCIQREESRRVTARLSLILERYDDQCVVVGNDLLFIPNKTPFQNITTEYQCEWVTFDLKKMQLKKIKFSADCDPRVIITDMNDHQNAPKTFITKTFMNDVIVGVFYSDMLTFWMMQMKSKKLYKLGEKRLSMEIGGVCYDMYRHSILFFAGTPSVHCDLFEFMISENRFFYYPLNNFKHLPNSCYAFKDHLITYTNKDNMICNIDMYTKQFTILFQNIPSYEDVFSKAGKVQRPKDEPHMHYRSGSIVTQYAIYTFGGTLDEFNNIPTNSLWRFDLKTCTWENLSQENRPYHYLPHLCDSQLVYVKDGITNYLIIIGGHKSLMDKMQCNIYAVKLPMYDIELGDDIHLFKERMKIALNDNLFDDVTII
jgi:hypothetical protein